MSFLRPLYILSSFKFQEKDGGDSTSLVLTLPNARVQSVVPYLSMRIIRCDDVHKVSLFIRTRGIYDCTPGDT